MMNRMLAGVLSIMMLAVPGVSLAAADISLGPVSLFNFDSCDAITFNVSVPDEGALDVVEVKLDGTILFESDDVDDPAVIPFDKVLVAEGEHTLSATIYDNDSKDVVLASDTYDFLVDCQQAPKLFDDGNRHLLSGGNEGGDGDCCPGPGGDSGAHDDEGKQVAAATSSTPKVAGATTSLTDLAPLNSIFRSVFGRNPTFQEWTYWAERMLTDKPQADAIFGAMQWHKLRGRTMGA